MNSQLRNVARRSILMPQSSYAQFSSPGKDPYNNIP